MGRRQGDRRRGVDPAVHRGHRRRAGIDEHIRFHHRIVAAGWSSAEARWHITAERADTGDTIELNHMAATGRRRCTPVNGDPAVTSEPLLGLSSGYIQRSAHLFPKQGSRPPWRVHQSYLRDYRSLKRSAVDDGAMLSS